MKRIIGLYFTLLIMGIVSTCGRKTAPVPYDSRIDSLPLAQVHQPLFKGNRLILTWQVNYSVLLPGDGDSDLKEAKENENDKPEDSLERNGSDLGSSVTDAKTQTTSDKVNGSDSQGEDKTLVTDEGDTKEPNNQQLSDDIKFHLRVYNKLNRCYSCENKPIELMTLSTFKGEQPVILKVNKDGNDQLLFLQNGNQFSLSIPRDLTDQWIIDGLFYFTIDYVTAQNELSEESTAVWPVYNRIIPLPVIIDVKSISSEGVSEFTHSITWEHIREVVQIKNGNKESGHELDVHFGLNLYRSKTDGGTEELELINQQPLKKGFYLFSAGESTIIATHVDRFGNESDPIEVPIPSRIEEPKNNPNGISTY